MTEHMEKVECIGNVKDGAGMHGPGEQFEVPANEVSKLVLDGAVKRMGGTATDDEKVAKARAELKAAEAEAIAAEKKASDSMLVAIEDQNQMKGVQKIANEAFRLRLVAIQMGEDMAKADAARAEAIAKRGVVPERPAGGSASVSIPHKPGT